MTELSIANLPAERIDEIPIRRSARQALVVSIATSMLAALGIGFWHYGPPAYATFLESNAAAQVHLEDIGLARGPSLSFDAFGILGAMCGVIGLLSLLRHPVTYYIIRTGLFLVYPALLGYFVLVWIAVFSFVDAHVPVDGGELDRPTGLLFWWELSWPALAIGAYVFWLHVMLWSRPVYSAFTAQVGPVMRGDRILEDWRTHGRDPRARKSFYGSFATHFAILVLIPFLLQARGCVEAYRVPKGSGNPVVALVKIVKPKKEKKQKLTLRPNSAIIFEIPELDDTEVDRKMDEMSQATYEADVTATAGQLGSGGGKQGGWPEGMENYKIRFIRLKHGGAGWDDGMKHTNADINFLRAFAQVTPFKKIASKGEAHEIAALEDYPEFGFPPFVYLTGNGGMGRTTRRDHKILREYCLKGGMLIADAGNIHFHRSFERFIRDVFPDKSLLDIADDEMIYQLPFPFPDGAPAFWHHGGRRAKGIRHDGRWIVFYHPGDMNDAWKSSGYSDVTPEMRNAAVRLGVNLVVYSFTQWNDAVARMRK